MIFACDIGSSFTKMALIDRQELVCASYRKPLTLEQQDGTAWEQILNDMASVLKGHNLEAFCFSSHGPSLMAIDKTGQSIGVIHRTDPDIAQFRAGSSFYLPLARALWQRLGPKQQEVAWLLPPVNYLCYRLTDNISIPVPKNYYDFYWPASDLTKTEKKHFAHIQGPDFLQLDCEFLHLLPPLSPFTQAIGTVSQSALERLKLANSALGLPVFCPGVDFFAGEAGLYQSPETMLRNRTGSSEGFNLLLPKQLSSIPLPPNKPGLFLSRHVISDRVQLCYVQEGTGELFAQLFTLWSQNQDAALPDSLASSSLMASQSNLQCAALQRSLENLMLQEILQEASKTQAEEARNFAKEFILRKQAPTKFLELLQKQQLPFAQLGLHILQLLVEYFWQNCELLFTSYEKYSSHSTKEVLLSGGQAYYPNWLSWKAQQSEITLHTPNICEAEFIGAAAICFYELKFFSSMEAASAHFFQIAQTYP